MMKIAYDAQIFFEQAYGGVSRYFCEIAARISTFQDMQVSITAPMHINAYLGHLSPHIVSGFRLPRTEHLSLSVRGVGMLMGDLMLRAVSPDVIHETYFFPYRLGPRRSRRVLTICDMIHEKFASDFASTDRTARFKLMAAERADHIVCISEATRRDVIELLGIAPDKISVIYLGFGLMNDVAPIDAEKMQTFDEPFILYVGNRGRYKNFLGLLQAYGSSNELIKRFKLVCFGGGSFISSEFEAIAKLGLNGGRVIQIGGGDQILASLYKSAVAFVYPSLYEGFGIPPLEAMSFDCPVVCSKEGSIPEVVGDAGEYFDPKDIESMRDSIESTVESSSRRNVLIAKGKQRLNLFSWDRCSRETADVYRQLT
jgi:glycosyltransferase involved in cell wall biosynthesis